MATSSLPSAPPHAPDEDAEECSSGRFPVAHDFVAVSVREDALLAAVRNVLGSTGVVDCGVDAIELAWTVIAEACGDAIRTIAELRGRMRSDAALILIVASRADVSAAFRAGAFACVQLPLVDDELAAALGAASSARVAKLEAADLSRQLDLQSHLASIGRLSAGLSHEIGNPLAVASLCAEEIQQDLAAFREITAALRQILAATDERELSRRARTVGAFALRNAPAEDSSAFAELKASHQRINDLVRLMRELMGPRSATRDRVELRPIVERVRQWATAGAAQGLDVETAYDGNVVAVGQARLVEQILVNLLENAAHAVRALGSPRIRLHVYPHKDFAVVSVRDNGPGIAPQIQSHLFEPFVTTRRGEGGTGLGLALCREYARQMGAEISVATAPGRGCCFRLRLRRAN